MLVVGALPYELVIAVAVSLESLLLADMAMARSQMTGGVTSTPSLAVHQSLQRAKHKIPHPRRWLSHRSSRCAVCFGVADAAKTNPRQRFVQHSVGDGWSFCGAGLCRQLMSRWSEHLHETTLTR